MKRAGDNDKSGSDQDLKKVRAVEDSDAGAGEEKEEVLVIAMCRITQFVVKGSNM